LNKITQLQLVLISGILSAAGPACSKDSGFALSGPGNDGGWQIVVKRFRGPGSEQIARDALASLKRVRGLVAGRARIFHERGAVVLSYGRYRKPENPAARRDLTFIKSLMIEGRGRPFLDAHFEPIPEPDPPIPSSWLLTNSGGYWTLEIARFDGPGRKSAAVEFLKTLRRRDVPAFVWHGTIRSTVTVGTFPEAAVKPLVARGRVVMAMGLKPVDPQLKKWKKKFPYLAINGQYRTYRKVLKGKATEQAGRWESQIIKIPKPGGTLW